MDRRRTGGELPLLLVGWPWYQEVVGLSDEDKETESAKKHMKEKVKKSVKNITTALPKFQETLWKQGETRQEKSGFVSLLRLKCFLSIIQLRWRAIIVVVIVVFLRCRAD